MLYKLKKRWQEEAGYREVLVMAIPLILSTGSWSIQHFVDRIFLTWYSPEAIAAALPAGLVNWTFSSFFIGVASYVNTFVAQYYGARRYQRIGPAVWQGIYLAFIALIAVALIYPLSPHFFGIFKHPSNVVELETEYFRILLLGAPFPVITNAISSFFTGLGKTWVVLYVNLLITGLNMLLDYLWIFGKLGFPAAGIRGAGLATVTATVIGTVVFGALFALPAYSRRFRTLGGWHFDTELFRRLLRYGAPNGIQFTLEILVFAIFIMLVGRYGVTELAATNITFNINTLAFLPMEGMSIAVSSLVGRRLGENRPGLAAHTTWSAFHLTFTFFFILAIGYVLTPEIFLYPYRLKADPVQFAPIQQTVIILLRFVAIYSLFDAMSMIFSAALKGAGDTQFVAVVSVSLAISVLLIPSFLITYVFHASLLWLWSCVTMYIVGLGVTFWWRFRKGPWQRMRVIETSNF